MTSNKVIKHHQRSRSVLCILIPIVLGACGSNAPNEKVDAGQRRYCDAACLDVPADQASEAGGNRDTQDTSPRVLDAGLDDTVRPDGSQDGVAGEARFDDAIDGAGGGGGVDVAGDTGDGGGKEVAPEVGPESGPETSPETSPETRDLPAGDSADGKSDVADVPSAPGPEVADVPSDGTDLPPPDTPPETPRDTVDLPPPPDSPPAVCSIGSGSSSWAKAGNGVANAKLPLQQGMATALDGTLWVSGQYSANFNFGSGTVTYGPPYGGTTPGTTPNGFVAKLNPATGLASAAWGFAKPSDKQQLPLLIAIAGVDGSGGGNVGIAGSFDGEMDFTGNYSDDTLSPSGVAGTAGIDYLATSGVKGFYAVFDSTSAGAYVTPVKAHIVNVGSGTLYAFASHPSQKAFVICGKTSIAVANWKDSGTNAGIIRNPLALDAGVGTFGGGNTDLVVAKIDATTGLVIWGRQYGGAGDQVCESAALDADGNVIIAGNYNGDLFQLDNVADTSGTVTQLFLAKLSADTGDLVSAVAFAAVGTPGISHAFALAVDGGGNIVMGGSIANGVDFKSGHVASYSGLTDAFVAKFDSSFNSLWVMSDGDSGYDQSVRSVAVSSTGDVFIGGSLKGSLPYLGLGDSTHNGALDAFAAQLASGNGSKVCAHAYGDADGAQSINNVTVARTAPGELKDSVFVGGPFTNTITFGSTTIVSPGNSCTVDTVANDCKTQTTGTCQGGICFDNSTLASFVARLAP